MPIDTHAAFRKLENGGFETQQAEALVEVINGVAGEQATKDDIRELREEIKEQREDFNVALKEQREYFNAAFKEQREDFNNRFATKEDFAKLETRIEAASNRVLLALIAVAGLLFAALKLWP